MKRIDAECAVQPAPRALRDPKGAEEVSLPTRPMRRAELEKDLLTSRTVPLTSSRRTTRRSAAIQTPPGSPSTTTSANADSPRPVAASTPGTTGSTRGSSPRRSRKTSSSPTKARLGFVLECARSRDLSDETLARLQKHMLPRPDYFRRTTRAGEGSLLSRWNLILNEAEWKHWRWDR